MRIWFLTHRLPYSANRGDRIRAYHILRFLQRRADVDLFSLVHDDVERSSVRLLDGQASSVTTAAVPHWRNRLRAVVNLPTDRPLTLSLLDAPELRKALAAASRQRPPDVILAFCSSMARFALEPPLRGFPLVVDMLDVDSEKWRALAAAGSRFEHFIYGREARLLRMFEGRLLDAAAVTVAINDREAEELHSIRAHAPIVVATNGIDVDFFRPPGPPSEDPAVVFCGVMDYKPNEQAALRLIRRIWPRVLAKHPGASLVLLGANPTSELKDAARSATNVSVTGAVPDVRPYLWASALAVAPLEIARGVQNKVLEAVAAGLPTVVSPVVAAGLPAAIAGAVRTAETDEAFASVVLEWLSESGPERRARASAGDLNSLTWEHQLQPLWAALSSAAAPAG
jgi:sugar transferase (PEP-CTERM/EpsH1 system associated)